MALEIYKTPPPLVFSGNQVIFGVKDNDLLTSNTRQHCVAYMDFSQSLVSTNYFSMWYDKKIQFDNIPVKGTMSWTNYMNVLLDLFLSEHDIVERFHVKLANNFIWNMYFIEREPLMDISLKLDSPAGLHNGVILYNSSQINYDQFHAIGIRPMKSESINLGVPGGYISEIETKYGEGEEVESQVTIIEQINELGSITDGSLYIEKSVHEMLRARTDGHFTLDLNEDKYKVHDLAQRFVMNFYKAAGTPIVKSGDILSDPFYVIQAEISKAKQAWLNEQGLSMYQHLVNTSIPLTWTDSEKTIDIYHPERLYFLAKTADEYFYKVKKYYTIGDPETVTLATFNTQTYQVVELSAAFMDIREEEDTSIVKYEVWIENGEAEIVMAVQTRIINYTMQQNARWWMFKNGFGVYECIRTTGVVTKNADIEKQFISRQLPDLYVKTDKEFEQTDSKTIIELEFNSGPLTRSQANYYTEFLDSEDVYLLNAGKAIPAKISGAKYLIQKDQENLVSINAKAELMTVDDEYIDLTPQLPIAGDWNNDFNESFN